MGLKCLLGHDFGEPETEREREERGDEVVITVRQVETCRRCGERRVVSENKEVTAIEQLLEAADPADSTPAEGRDAPDAETPVDGRAPDADPTGARNGSGSPSAVEAGGATFADDGFEPRSADEDDGVILDDGDDEPPERRPGEWPDADANRRGAGGGGRDDTPESPTDGRADASESGTGGWPTVEGEDEGYSAGPSANGGPEDVSFGAGLTPDGSDAGSGGGSTEVGGPPDEGAELIDDGPSDGDALAPDSGIVDRGGDPDDEAGSGGFTRADSPSVDGPPSTGSGGAELYCPECDLVRPAVGSSLRAGDICPDCHRGYVTERER